MGAILEYKCPCCCGPLQFDTDSQKMKCPYCDNEFDAETLKANDDILKEEKPDMMDWSSQPGNEWMQGELDGQKVYLCNSCGGQIICDDTTGSTDCPYCGSPVVLVGQFAGDKRPDLIIPFKLDKEAAKAGFKQHLQKKRLLPKQFRKDSYIDEVKGVYVPFWLFGADADAQAYYHATKVSCWSDSQYNYTKTSHFRLFRSGSLSFERVPVDGSSKMADDLMESIEPYYAQDEVPFQTAYLSGYIADKYDVDSDASIGRANDRIKKSTLDQMATTAMGYTTVTPENASVQFKNSSVKYALYPVWLLTAKWNGEIYNFAMNGQTGKFVGNLPMDKGAYWRWTGLIALIATVIAFGVSWFLFLN
ncbi:MAG: hypothetical protein ACI4JI_09650 [Ruminiclostridium sp.]